MKRKILNHLNSNGPTAKLGPSNLAPEVASTFHASLSKVMAQSNWLFKGIGQTINKCYPLCQVKGRKFVSVDVWMFCTLYLFHQAPGFRKKKMEAGGLSIGWGHHCHANSLHLMPVGSSCELTTPLHMCLQERKHPSNSNANISNLTALELGSFQWLLRQSVASVCQSCFPSPLKTPMLARNECQTFLLLVIHTHLQLHFGLAQIILFWAL